MYEICRKDRLCRNLNRLQRIFPRDYNFFPTTWDLPTEFRNFMLFLLTESQLQSAMINLYDLQYDGFIGLW